MITLSQDLPPEQRIFLAVDTSNRDVAEEQIDLARNAGASVVKLGLELSSSTSWRECSTMAYHGGVDWVADAKIDDIPNTTAGIVDNLLSFDHPPIGITIHTNSGVDSMSAAQQLAEQADVMMLGVTQLTSISQKETVDTYRLGRDKLVKRRLQKAVSASIGGLVCSPRELERVVSRSASTRAMFSMIPGTRSAGADSHDQRNTTTPYTAVFNGASGLVIGRQITKSVDPAAEFARVKKEIADALEALNK